MKNNSQMLKVDTREFFEKCADESPIKYMGKIAFSYYTETDNCYCIAQEEDWESIYEDQVANVYFVRDNVFIIEHDNGDTSQVEMM